MAASRPRRLQRPLKHDGDYHVAQELANLSGTDCKTKYGAAPDNVVVDGQSYLPVPPPA